MTTARYIITMPEFMINAGDPARAWGRMTLTDPLGWVEPQFAHTFENYDEAIKVLVDKGFGIGAPAWVREI